MKSHISKMRVTALAVGLAIVMSSCGIQNQAGDSSSAPAAGKTKNVALVNGQGCFESESQFSAEVGDAVNLWNNNYYNWFPNGDVYPVNVVTIAGFVIGVDYQNDPSGFADAYWNTFRSPIIGGCEEQIALLDGSVVAGVSNVATGAVSVKACVKPEVKQSIIDGYTEQLARPLGGEVTDAYLAEMQKGLDISNGMCTN